MVGEVGAELAAHGRSRPLLIALALAAFAAGLFVVANVGDGSGDGNLDPDAALVEAADVPGVPLWSGGAKITMGSQLEPGGQDKVTFGGLTVDNTTPEVIEVVSVKVVSLQEGTSLLGIRLNEFDSNGIGTMAGWTDMAGDADPEGFQIPPGGYVEVVIGLQGSPPGGADLVEIVYRSAGTTYSTTYDYHYELKPVT